mmetsp:Transcript_95626/g.166091  ORF Transcript_95626/g.166091 Transcript_95626/m.166091 type:complete len:231 (+) Transcript_95626:126-818(+)
MVHFFLESFQDLLDDSHAEQGANHVCFLSRSAKIHQSDDHFIQLQLSTLICIQDIEETNTVACVDFESVHHTLHCCVFKDLCESLPIQHNHVFLVFDRRIRLVQSQPKGIAHLVHSHAGHSCDGLAHRFPLLLLDVAVVCAEVHQKLPQRFLLIFSAVSSLIPLALNRVLHHIVNKDCHDQVEESDGDKQEGEHVGYHELCSPNLIEDDLQRSAIMSRAALCETAKHGKH